MSNVKFFIGKDLLEVLKDRKGAFVNVEEINRLLGRVYFSYEDYLNNTPIEEGLMVRLCFEEKDETFYGRLYDSEGNDEIMVGTSEDTIDGYLENGKLYITCL